jgi:hypothetical protein
MPKTIAVLIGLLCCMSVMQADEFTTMKDVLIEMAGYVEYLEDSLDQEIVHLQADIITGDGKTFTRMLHEGWTYGIAAFGDWRVEDLDIVVYEDIEGEWIEVDTDDDMNNNPEVVVMPEVTKQYMIELNVHKWEEDFSAAHYGMLIYHE